MIKQLIAALTLMIISVSAYSAGLSPAVNLALASFQDKLDNPQFKRFGVNQRVNMVFGYDYSNWTIIDGDEGLIIIDSGWFIERTKKALQDFRATQHNQKPIKAIIFTHMHSDHIGGISGLLEGIDLSQVDIYAHEDWQRQVKYDLNSGQMLVRRGMSQMGFLLPYKDVAKGTYGSGIGRNALRGGTLSPSVTPNKKIHVNEHSGPQSITIQGIPMEFHYGPSDIDAEIIVWLPEDKVVLVGDAVGGTLPYVITPRHEPERKPESFLYTFNQILALNPNNLIPGHGRALEGKKDIQNVIEVNRDTIAFLDQQVRAYINNGYSADQIIDELVLPPRLANHPDLQPRYHTLNWLIRGLYTNEAGWVQDVNSLTQHSASEQAKRWIKLVGVKGLLGEAQKSIQSGDFRWAVTVAQTILNTQPNNGVAKKLLMGGLQGIAYTTESAAERNYALTELASTAGKFNWDMVFTRVTSRLWAQRGASAAFERLNSRFDSKASYGETFNIEFTVKGEGTFSFEVDDGILRYHTEKLSKIDAKVSLTLETARKIGSKAISLSDALSEDGTLISKGEKLAKVFSKLIN